MPYRRASTYTNIHKRGQAPTVRSPVNETLPRVNFWLLTLQPVPG